MIGLSPIIDKQSDIPVYKQLYTYIRQEIEAGALRENERLPSIRQLSAHLVLSKNTVETAYQQLHAEGYVESKPRSGMHVVPIERIELTTAAMQMSDKETKPLQNPDLNNQPLFDFQYGDVDLDSFPLKIWKKCLVDALQHDSYEIFGYGDPQGNGELREQLVKYVYQSRGVVCSSSQVFLCSGTQQAISLLCQLLPLSQRVAMEEPGYDGVRTVLANHGRDIQPIPLETDGIEVNSLRQQSVKAVYVTPSHQFPLGSVLSAQKRSKLLQWAYEVEGLIIEDDYDSEFRYQGQPIPALKAMDIGDRVIYLGTFSKSFLPAVRMSYLVLPEQMAISFRKALAPYSQSVSPLLQKAMLLFMREGHYERHIRKMRKLYQTRHRALLKAIQQHMGHRVEVIGQKAGLHMLLDVRNHDNRDLIKLALQHGVKVYSPNHHWMNPSHVPSSYVMLGFGGMNDKKVEEGVLRLKKAWFSE
ncbi:PLP-dependent aminotransferase family protein [Cohnella sp. WQ 127256]|uniref:MocR-like pyridoxine biosynthesis transcription factor PdxR n=1 Tax=Cohnella sp. WQ 127256 TaxID=2938790 RepID=UPI00211882A9|nr:PLP-dependent aminotransferase family protein [Cohnella sp. WQ 127256]